MTAKGTGNQTSKAQGESEYPSTRAPRETAKIPTKIPALRDILGLGVMRARPT